MIIGYGSSFQICEMKIILICKDYYGWSNNEMMNTRKIDDKIVYALIET